jgi:glycosyltransferase involved in cell wall biosynthesis
MQSSQLVSVTIGIPTYNRLHYLKESTASALAQDYPNLEILISQNPHPDPQVREPIAEYCRNLAASDSRIRYQLLPKDEGPPANFNEIGDAARGEYLMMIGDDDHLLPHAISNLASVTGPNTILSFGKRYVIDSDGVRVKSYLGTQPGGWGPPPPGPLPNPEPWAWQQAMATETSLMRTEVFRRLRFREYVDMPDMEYFIVLAREGGEFIFTPEYVTEIRVHKNSTTGRGFVNYCELADLLAPLEVSREVEPEKTRKLIYLTHLAVIGCLLNGNVKDARRLLKTRYFDERAFPTRLCASLPPKLAVPMYKAYRRLRSAGEEIGALN